MAGGDEQALGALYDRWVTRVHAVVFQLLGDADDAEDVTEEAFWQAWRQAGRYDAARGSPAAWLVAIARSRALDRLRARRRRLEIELPQPATASDTPAPELATGRPDPLAGAEAAERRDRVVAALSALPPEQCETIRLAYFGGLSQVEIAERMGQPLGTVKTRVRLALDKLRESLSMLRDEALREPR